MLLQAVAVVALTVADLAHATAVTPKRQTSQSESSEQEPSSAPSLTRWTEGPHLAVDYYPSQWPEYMWEDDIAQMSAANISYVRINEFDWAILEPAEGQYNFTLLDQTLDLLQRYQLQAIIGTPTAAPPDWLYQKYDISFVDYTNTTKQFGSRRYYSSSSPDYRRMSQQITRQLAERYGNHSAVAGWQLDNEFGCHDTVQSYDQNAIQRFRIWLQDKYGTIDQLNAAQGRVFWSNQYTDFDAIHPPYMEVYTPPPSHLLDWYRFSSDMMIEFAREQATILRQHAPTQFITTNMMMGFLAFDHFKFAREVGLDLATFDEYPLSGPSTVSWLSAAEQANYLYTGLPDWQALHHALYRGVAGAAYNTTAGPFGVMEMEPGVLNWSPYRVSPLPGMVRLWTHETFADSGDMVSYFRWRQVPFGAEQTLSGLFTSDNTADEGFDEMQTFAHEDLPILIKALKTNNHTHSQKQQHHQADVALIFSYTAHQAWTISPYSGTWDPTTTSYTDPTVTYLELVYKFYSALRRLGLSIDILPADHPPPLQNYKLIVIPSLPIIPPTLNETLANHSGPIILGPHTGALTETFSYQPGLAPARGPIHARLPMKVTRIETPPDYAGQSVAYAGRRFNISGWAEWVVCGRDEATRLRYTGPRHRQGRPAGCAANGVHYLGVNPTVELLVAYLGDVAREANLTDVLGRSVRGGGGMTDLGPDLRFARRGAVLWGFNYGLEAVRVPEILGARRVVIGSRNGSEIPAAGVVVWRLGGDGYDDDEEEDA
ncbi:beta-galactosidase [Aspergillus aculeatinus CBS 121060]|uniref:Uncharacterized protein n=1 Tax=Aspergillus aculeatinus CBS 121060 TaxID=1448322 RepID=A0ACD1GWE3_9EURO|nr:hypothetical protein BO66DRAFT_333296 [Aspergillus aculeatinus CBS 121060]RAH65649.1 hypothetical protein BO66DRAFT_333296 [Aspergillus aculeatinus CBS 121060]